MNHHLDFEHGNFSFLASIFLGVLAFFGEHMDTIIRVIVAIGSIATAIMACRYYYFSIKEKKQEIKRNNKEGL